ncbi:MULTISPECIES: hypothetical protein [Pedobacter]|uniref:hypothetical protein n=1 Tax=Pedobacter TaxID=84567 RepID=UPI001E32E964|nr:MULTISPECIES: hypothetical protein [Pedobacter]
MKKLLIAAALAACFATSISKAQTVNGIRLSEIKADYIQFKGIRRTFSDKYLISLEYGQNITNFENSYVKDDNGKKMEFDSTFDFLNKVKGYGYELFQIFPETTGTDSNRPMYVLKRK